MKRLLMLMAVAILLAACGNDDAKEEETAPVSKEETTEKVEEVEKVEEPEEITTETEINFHDGAMTVSGRTNLPDGEEVIISVSGEEYVAADTQIVDDGLYSSAAFTKQGDPLPSGEYTVKVKSKIGDSLEHEETVTIE